MFYEQVIYTLVGALFVQAALASPLNNGHIPSRREIPATHALHERQLPHTRHTWERKSKVQRDALLPMRVGLHQRNLEEGHDLLMERSNPTSSQFGKRMTSQEVIDFFAPPRESVEAVRNWLVAGGIEASRISLSANKQWIQFDATTTEAESLLHTDFYYWKHGVSGTESIAAEEYHIPTDIQGHIDYITPGVGFRADTSQIKRAKRHHEARGQKDGSSPAFNIESHLLKRTANSILPLNTSTCDLAVIPECIKLQYQIPNGTKASTGNELGIFEGAGNHYSKEDLDAYFSTLYPEIPNGTYPIDKNIDGAFGAANSTASAASESNLDFEAAMPLIWPQRTVLFQTDDEVYEEEELTQTIKGFFNTFLDAIDGSYCTFSAYNETGNCVTDDCLDPIYPNPNPNGYQGQLQCGVYKPTHVISISYDASELDRPVAYTKRQCAEIMKLGLQGTTVVVSSGDNGVGQVPGDPTDNGCLGLDEKIFNPSSDANCPYVLAVGSTELVKEVNPEAAAATTTCSSSSTPWYLETATSSFASGGGFSNYYDVPCYQAEHVKRYFDRVQLNFTGYTGFNASLSNVGDGVYRIGGRGYPDVAAIGDHFVYHSQGVWDQVGGTSLSAPIWASVLTLINEERIADNKSTLGFVNPILYAHPEVFNDVINGSNPNCGTEGFPATVGWDPVTGLGSPNYPKLLELLKSLP